MSKGKSQALVLLSFARFYSASCKLYTLQNVMFNPGICQFEWAGLCSMLSRSFELDMSTREYCYAFTTFPFIDGEKTLVSLDVSIATECMASDLFL